jgi:hypothetical protein
MKYLGTLDRFVNVTNAVFIYQTIGRSQESQMRESQKFGTLKKSHLMEIAVLYNHHPHPPHHPSLFSTKVK